MSKMKTQKKVSKKPAKNITVKLPDVMDFAEAMTRIVRVKPPK